MSKGELTVKGIQDTRQTPSNTQIWWEQRGEGLTRPLFIVGGAIDYPESPLGVPCGGEVKLNKLAVSNNIVLIIVTVILSI